MANQVLHNTIQLDGCLPIDTDTSIILMFETEEKVRLVEIMNETHDVNVVTIDEVIDPIFDEQDAFTIARAIYCQSVVGWDEGLWIGLHPMLPISFFQILDFSYLAALVYCWHTPEKTATDDGNYRFRFNGEKWEVSLIGASLHYIKKL